MRVSSVRAIMESTRGQGSADSFWLARREMGRAWLSHVLAWATVRHVQKTKPVWKSLCASVDA